jgi:hypothetical protein
LVVSQIVTSDCFVFGSGEKTSDVCFILYK